MECLLGPADWFLGIRCIPFAFISLAILLGAVAALYRFDSRLPEWLREWKRKTSPWFWALIGVGCYTVILVPATCLPVFLLIVLWGGGVSMENALFALRMADWRTTAVYAGIPWLVLAIVGLVRWRKSRASEAPEDTEQDAG